VWKEARRHGHKTAHGLPGQSWARKLGCFGVAGVEVAWIEFDRFRLRTGHRNGESMPLGVWPLKRLEWAEKEWRMIHAAHAVHASGWPGWYPRNHGAVNLLPSTEYGGVEDRLQLDSRLTWEVSVLVSVWSTLYARRPRYLGTLSCPTRSDQA